MLEEKVTTSRKVVTIYAHKVHYRQTTIARRASIEVMRWITTNIPQESLVVVVNFMTTLKGIMGGGVYVCGGCGGECVCTT